MHNWAHSAVAKLRQHQTPVRAWVITSVPQAVSCYG